LFFSRIDNPTEIKSLGVLLARYRYPPVALATPLKVLPIANTKDATRWTIPPEYPRLFFPCIRAAPLVYRFLADKLYMPVIL